MIRFNPRPPAVPFIRRLGYLGDTCTAEGATVVSTAAPTATIQPIAGGGRVSPTIRGLQFGRLGVNTGTGGAALTAVGVTGKGGTSGAVTGAAKGASVGASVGSAVFPGVGTAIGAAIGAVLGAVAGGVIHTSDFANWLATDTNIIKILQQLPANFQGRTLPKQTPTQNAPITLEMIWTAIVVTGNMYNYTDAKGSPSDMQNEFNWIMAWMASILQCMNKYPIGAKISMSISVGNGVNFTLSFVNPGSANSATVANNVMIPAYLAWCTHNGAVDTQASHCPGDAANPLNRLVLTLMTDYQIAQYPPPASQAAPPKTAAAVAAPKTATVVPAKTATVTVSSPAAVTTVTAGKAVTVAACHQYFLKDGTPYWDTAAGVPCTPTAAERAAAAPSVAAPPSLAQPAPVVTSAAIQYYILNGDLDSGTTLPAGAIPLTQAQYTLMLTQPSSSAAQQLYDSLMGGTAPAAAVNSTAPIAAPTIITVPGQAAAPIAASDDTMLYLLAGVAVLFLVMQKK
jgi:hypothetical protein